jgi:hypothetical protein
VEAVEVVAVHHLHHLTHHQALLLQLQEEVAMQLIQVKKLSLPGFLRGVKRKMKKQLHPVVEVEVEVEDLLLHLHLRKKRRRISFKLQIRGKPLLQLLITLNHKVQWQILNSNQGS